MREETTCQYDYGTDSITLIDTAAGHAPILILLTPREKLLPALLERNMLAKNGRAYHEAMRLRKDSE